METKKFQDKEINSLNSLQKMTQGNLILSCITMSDNVRNYLMPPERNILSGVNLLKFPYSIHAMLWFSMSVDQNDMTLNNNVINASTRYVLYVLMKQYNVMTEEHTSGDLTFNSLSISSDTLNAVEKACTYITDTSYTNFDISRHILDIMLRSHQFSLAPLYGYHKSTESDKQKLNMYSEFYKQSHPIMEECIKVMRDYIFKTSKTTTWWIVQDLSWVRDTRIIIPQNADPSLHLIEDQRGVLLYDSETTARIFANPRNVMVFKIEILPYTWIIPDKKLFIDRLSANKKNKDIDMEDWRKAYDTITHYMRVAFPCIYENSDNQPSEWFLNDYHSIKSVAFVK